MEQSTISPITDLKTVKNSSAFYVGTGSEREFVCMHYSSIIFRAQRVEHGWKVTSLYVPSVTSSKMAGRCLAYLNINENWKDLKARFDQ